ncbi:MAG: sporulation transcriptional regulator SpoIIID [Bacilli bacterium]
MNTIILDRIIKEANYIKRTKQTVRQLASYFDISKSTIDKDLHHRLKEIDVNLYDEVQAILNYHASIRHIRGGLSTKNKYQKIRG